MKKQYFNHCKDKIIDKKTTLDNNLRMRINLKTLHFSLINQNSIIF